MLIIMLRSSYSLAILDSIINTDQHHKLKTYSFRKIVLRNVFKDPCCQKTHHPNTYVLNWEIALLVKDGNSYPRTHIKNLGMVVCACNHSVGQVKTC